MVVRLRAADLLGLCLAACQSPSRGIAPSHTNAAALRIPADLANVLIVVVEIHVHHHPMPTDFFTAATVAAR
jgi:hypothetical protein